MGTGEKFWIGEKIKEKQDRFKSEGFKKLTLKFLSLFKKKELKFILFMMRREN